MSAWSRRCLPFLLSLLAAAPAAATHHCFPTALRCGTTVQTSIDATECFVNEKTYGDLYTFAAPAGSQLTLQMTSTDFTPSILLFDPTPDLVVQQDGTSSTLTLARTLTESGLWRFIATTVETKKTGGYTLSLDCSSPPPPAGPWLHSAAVPGFQFKVQIAAAHLIAGAQESACIPDTLCVSGSIPGHSEVFLRVAYPKPNGHLWPTIVKFTTSQIEVWVEQQKTGQIRYYLLPGAGPTGTDLPGLFDKVGFLP